MEDHTTASPRPVRFGERPDVRPPFKGVTSTSVYIPMRDGTQIAADVMRPKSAPGDLRLPTVLVMARYWRSFELRGLEPTSRAPIGPRPRFPDFLLSHGYAVVIVDSRGSGASTGSTPYPWNEAELEDYGEVVDWVLAQPWSDGGVGAMGISYEGVTATLLPVVRPEGTRAVVPQQPDLDNYADVFFPGGVPRISFIEGWQRTNAALDRNEFPSEWTSGGAGGHSLLVRAAAKLTRLVIKGVRPVDSDDDRRILRRAVEDHASNADVAAYAKSITFRDDPFGPTGLTLDDFSVTRHRREIQRSGTPLFTWASWLDGNTADVAIRSFASYTNPQRAVVGAWSHHYLNHGSPYTAPGAKLRPSQERLWQEAVEFLDHYLKGSESTDPDEGRLIYYTMGEEAWKGTDVWPPPRTTTERWYLRGDHELSMEPPEAGAGADDYTVDFEATTGLTNRWHTQDGTTKVVYRDRAEADRRLLTYTSTPLGEDVEITGYPVVTLYVSSTHDDGAFYVYLEGVDERGRVTYVTEGMLRALHRHVSEEEPPLKLFVPHHSFLRGDARPLVPGEVAELRFGLLPTSVLVRKGHRLRVAIAGHDRDTFARIPAEGRPTITVQRNRLHASCIDVPIAAG